MALWSQYGGGIYQSISSHTLECGSPAHSKGLFTTVISSTLYDANTFMIQASETFAGTLKYLVDVAIGDVGSEYVIIENLHWYVGPGISFPNMNYQFPVSIPKGSRLSLRGQSTVALADLRTSVQLGSGKWGGMVGSKITAYGVFTDSTDTTPSSANIWQPITLGTTYQTKGIIFTGGSIGGALGNAANKVDIGIGVTSSEITLFEFVNNSSSAADQWHPPTSQIIPMTIPLSSQLSFRSSLAGFFGAIYGIS